MYQYFLLLNAHRNLSLKRKIDYKKNVVIAITLGFMLFVPSGALLVTLTKEDIESLVNFVLPVIVVLDFSLRFFLKKNASAPIFPYLCLPIPKKTLILYIVLSDLQRFWLWGCWLIYCGVLLFFETLNVTNAIILLQILLINNYLITFIKSLIGGYAILTYPVCMVFVLLILFTTNVLNPIFSIIFAACIVFSFAAAFYFTLKEFLYEELNHFAL
jgi:hypothetical protein